MSDFAALAYLDFCRARNAVRNVIRTPSRLGLWIVYALWFGFMLYTRIEIGHLREPVTGVKDPLATFLALGFIFAVGVIIWRASGGQIGAFASPADARFLSASKLDERAVVTWLQLRGSATLIGRFLFLVFLYSMVFNRAGSVGGMLISMFAGAAFVASIPIPVIALSRRAGAPLMRGVAYVVMAAGAIPAALLALPLAHIITPFNALSARIPGLHLGTVLSSMLLGNPAPIIVLFMLAAALVVLAYTCATDLYPELYEASLTGFARLQRMRAYRRGTAPEAYKRTSTGKTPVAFNGGWALIWKDWIALRRAKRFAQVLGVGIAFWIILGAGLAFAFRGKADAVTLFIAFFAILANCIFIFVISAAVTLAADLRKPIWWLTPDGVRVRFYAWTISGSWKLAAGFAVCLTAYCAVSGEWTPLKAGLPVVLILPLVMRAVGLATYAIVPAPADQRGPMAFVRLLAMYLLLLPPAGAAAICAIALHNYYAATLAATAVALLEVVPLIEFATWRIQGNGAAFALLESGV